MKKIMMAILVGVLCMTLTACSKSEAATVGDELISAIGDVTHESIGAIIEAEMYVATMSAEDKEQLDNTQILSDARTEYENLLLGEIASIVDVAIGEIGSVTLDSGDAISNARTTYDDIDPAAQEKVALYDDLVAAEENFYRLQVEHAEEQVDKIGVVTVDSLDAIQNAETAINALGEAAQTDMKNYDTFLLAQEAYSQAKVSAVEEQIASIGTVTLESGTDLTLARLSYNALTSAQKSAVSNSALLTEAEDELQRLKEDVLASKIANCRTMSDDFKGVMYLYSSQQPQYINTRCYLLPVVIVYDNNEVAMAIWANYTGSDYLSLNEIIVLIDGTSYEWSSNVIDKDMNISYPNFCEYMILLADNNMISALRKIATSEETKVRFSGSESYDFTITQSDKAAIAEMLELYDLALDVYG